MPGTINVRPVSKKTSQDQQIDGLLSGVKWDPLTLTYSFPQDASDYESPYGSREPSRNFEGFGPDEQAAFRTIFAQIESFTKLSFTEVTAKDGDIRLGQSDLQNAEAWSYYPSTAPQGGDAWFDNDLKYESVEPGSYKYTVYMHEIGHSLGLKHSFEKGPMGTVPIDSLEYTVMSYSSYAGANDWLAPEFNYPQTYMMYDIAALQYMYGEDFSYNNRNTIYKWDPSTGELTVSENGGDFQAVITPETNKVFLTIWDGGGIDTFDFSGYTTGVSVNLQPGQWTTTSTEQLADLGDGRTAVGNIANALLYQNNAASLIENAIGGTGDDTFVGNMLANTFWGGAGADAISYQGVQSQYTVTKSGNYWTVASTQDGTDTLYDIEIIQFGDGSSLALVDGPVPPTDDGPGNGPKNPPGKPQKHEALVATQFDDVKDAPANNPSVGIREGLSLIDLLASRVEDHHDWLLA